MQVKNLNLQLFDSLYLRNDTLLVGGGCGKAKTGFSNGMVLLDTSEPSALQVVTRAETDQEIAFSLLEHRVSIHLFNIFIELH